jgi:integrase
VPGEFLFTSRRRPGEAMTTRQYARLVAECIAGIGLDPHVFGTHSLRRTKATLIYRRTGNLRAVQLLLGHTRIESTVRYLGIEVALASETLGRRSWRAGHPGSIPCCYCQGRNVSDRFPSVSKTL